MSRNYGSLNNRRGSAAWQWVTIGLILGFACSAVVVLAGLAGGIVTLGESVANLPTQTPFIITSTPPPATATIQPTPITPSPTVPLVAEAPTGTPTSQAVAPTIPPTGEGGLNSVGGISLGGGATANPGVNPGISGGAGTGTGANTPSVGAGAGVTPGAAGQNTPSVGSGAQNVSATGGNANLTAFASDLIEIGGGTFTMGTTVAEVSAAVDECRAGYGGEPGACEIGDGEDATPQRSVTISPFQLERTEVTYEQYLRFINSMGPRSHLNGCLGLPCMQTRNESETSNISFDSANYSVLPAINSFPMANVTWFGASAYCQALGRRLPTEAEWEYAARGQQGRLYPWGDDWNEANAVTNRSPLASPGILQPADSLPAGATLGTGVLHMAGNVEEWVSDWYATRYDPTDTLDPVGPVSGTDKVVRGGTWDFVPFFARSVQRRNALPNTGTAGRGFRCAADAATAVPATDANAPIGAALQPGATTDPGAGIVPGVTPAAGSTGTTGSGTAGSDEESSGGAFNSQPTLPPRATTAATTAPTTATTPVAVPGGTLAPG